MRSRRATDGAARALPYNICTGTHKPCNSCNCFLASFDGCTRLWFGLGLGLGHKFEALVSVPSRFITVPDHE